MNTGDRLGMFALCPLCGASLRTPAKVARNVGEASAVVVVDTTVVRDHLRMHAEPIREAARIVDGVVAS